MFEHLKNIILIILILVIVFLSQEPFFQAAGKDIIYGKVGNTVGVYYLKAEDFVKKEVISRIKGEVEKRENIAKEEIGKETEKISGNVLQRIKDYFLSLFNKVFSQKKE